MGIAFLILGVFFGLWIGFAKHGKREKWSPTIRWGGGFIFSVTITGLIAAVVLKFSDGADDAPTSDMAVQAGEVDRTTPTAFTLAASKLAASLTSSPTPAANQVIPLLPSIDFKVATINAGHNIEENDASIKVAGTYVQDVAQKYHTDPERAAGICVEVFNKIQEKGHQVTLFEVFEAARAIRKDDVLDLTEKNLAGDLVAYAASRGVQNHTDSVIGLRKIFDTTNVQK